jgi:predicted short-subunit dehydrogenase-like oxidoreductase (DUF2520 family)
MSIFQKNSVMIGNNISFAGAGRVASALCRIMYSKDFNIELIVSLSQQNGRSLADSCEASWSDKLIFPENTDILIVAVPDHNLEEVLNNLVCPSETLVVHTAGSMGMDVFPGKIKKKGVLYPLQTFSKNRTVDFNGLPFLIETPDDKYSATLKSLAESIGGTAYFADSSKRRMAHLAAVFICNFTNHMLTEGKELAVNAGLSFDLFKPLLEETISKAMALGPENAQTGPAVRNDQNTIEKHLDLLSFSPATQNVYREMTRSILKYYNITGI